MAIINPPAWMQNGTYDARTDRLMGTAFIERPGLTTPGAYPVNQSGTPAMNVIVGAGTAYIDRSGDFNLGMYCVRNDGPVTVTIATANATNARIDLVILRINDSQYSGVLNSATIEVVTGTPSASPVVPTLPANAIELARLTVGASVTSIVNANISSVGRVLSRIRSSMVGPEVVTSTNRPSGVSTGYQIYETDTGLTLIWDGTASKWRYQSGLATIQVDSPSVGTGNGVSWDMTAASTVSGSATKNASWVGTVNSGGITTTDDGVYAITMLGQFLTGFASGVRVYAGIQINGPLQIARNNMGPTGGEDHVSTSATLFLPAGTTIIGITWQNSGGIATRNMARLSVSRVS